MLGNARIEKSSRPSQVITEQKKNINTRSYPLTLAFDGDFSLRVILLGHQGWIHWIIWPLIFGDRIPEKPQTDHGQEGEE